MLAHNLGLEVVAEGAETQEQVNQLKQMDCELAQGYFFCRPADHEVILGFLKSHHSANANPTVGCEEPVCRPANPQTKSVSSHSETHL